MDMTIRKYIDLGAGELNLTYLSYIPPKRDISAEIRYNGETYVAIVLSVDRYGQYLALEFNEEVLPLIEHSHVLVEYKLTEAYCPGRKVPTFTISKVIISDGT